MGQAVIDVEAQAITALRARIDDTFVQACRFMLSCQGRIVVIGMGKSGHIGSKIAATLASTGSPAFFVHPGEASHGDLGMITPQDVVITISNSGETAEILTILPLIKRLGAPLIALVGNPDSTLGRMANVVLDISVEKEACPLGLAPTASTTATLAMGDALAVALLEARGFTEIDFARSHPGGSLGRRLLLLIDDVMHSGATVPRVGADASLAEALIEMNKKGLGLTTVVDAQQRLVGVFTDGDLRRVLVAQVDIRDARIVDVMTANCRSVRQGILAAEALQVMQKYKVNALPVVDDAQHVVGAFNMQSMLRAGVV
ncbi:MAG: KpsF/GutQ family sugar-phosphate isomerase [Gammaproteobacteria bacterium]|nr:KpsF/GutQ family sugar-phosphate isomerase [Gammaproteobacteria bacterium]